MHLGPGLDSPFSTWALWYLDAVLLSVLMLQLWLLSQVQQRRQELEQALGIRNT